MAEPETRNSSRGADPARAPRVFTTAQFVRRTTADDALQEVPGSVAHGKEMGTTLTLCGVSATSWHKLWLLPFACAPAPRCRACNEILAATAPSPRF